MKSPSGRSENFDIDSTKFRREIFNVFSTPNKNPLKYRRRINVEISTTVKISTVFRRALEMSYVFQHFSDVEISTSIQH